MQYAGIGDEHRAVRTRAGVFDVSHMGELRIAGDGAREYLQARLSNDLDRIEAGHAQYTLLTNERGGIVDDLIVYRRDDDDYLLVERSQRRGRSRRARRGRGRLERMGIPGRPGPGGPRAARARDRAVRVSEDVDVLGVRCLVAGTGYTGERGCELGCSPEDAVALWDAILDRGVEPCGLGARDTLRLEVCYPLHGNDISAERTPIEAGLGWACALEKDFTGVDVLRRQKEAGPAESWRPSS